jgi:hypothetical protein
LANHELAGVRFLINEPRDAVRERHGSNHPAPLYTPD